MPIASFTSSALSCICIVLPCLSEFNRYSERRGLLRVIHCPKRGKRGFMLWKTSAQIREIDQANGRVFCHPLKYRPEVGATATRKIPWQRVARVALPY